MSGERQHGVGRPRSSSGTSGRCSTSRTTSLPEVADDATWNGEDSGIRRWPEREQRFDGGKSPWSLGRRRAHHRPRRRARETTTVHAGSAPGRNALPLHVLDRLEEESRRPSASAATSCANTATVCLKVASTSRRPPGRRCHGRTERGCRRVAAGGGRDQPGRAHRGPGSEPITGGAGGAGGVSRCGRRAPLPVARRRAARRCRRHRSPPPDPLQSPDVSPLRELPPTLPAPEARAALAEGAAQGILVHPGHHRRPARCHPPGRWRRGRRRYSELQRYSSSVAAVGVAFTDAVSRSSIAVRPLGLTVDSRKLSPAHAGAPNSLTPDAPRRSDREQRHIDYSYGYATTMIPRYRSYLTARTPSRRQGSAPRELRQADLRRDRRTCTETDVSAPITHGDSKIYAARGRARVRFPLPHPTARSTTLLSARTRRRHDARRAGDPRRGAG